MAFQINLQNDGDDGTIELTERINLNQSVVIFDGFIDAGYSRVVDCQVSPKKLFTWIHRATNISGGPEEFGDGDTIRVSS